MVSTNTKKNTQKTYIIVFIITLLIGLIVYFILHAFIKNYIPILVACSFSLITSFILYHSSKSIILKLNKANLAYKEDYIELYNLVEELSAKAKLPTPSIYIIESEQPNAFSCRNKTKKICNLHYNWTIRKIRLL